MVDERYEMHGVTNWPVEREARLMQLIDEISAAIGKRGLYGAYNDDDGEMLFYDHVERLVPMLNADICPQSNETMVALLSFMVALQTHVRLRMTNIKAAALDRKLTPQMVHDVIERYFESIDADA